MRSTFECEVIVAGVEPARVLDAYWRLERWPEVAPHVLAIDLLYGDDEAQVLVMTVQTRGRVDAFKSVRVRAGAVIRYIQPRPPRILRHHHGSWTFEAHDGGTRVVSTHVIEVDVVAAAEVLTEVGVPFSGDDDVRSAIERLIRGNSLQTMRALQQRLETEVPHVQQSVA
ncbi:MAG TPA: SRPBCC family protein [Thermoanaerobaculia bacterium]|nr:SRPBCC family protein [Thermoanaerobaculia bacterium]